MTLDVHECLCCGAAFHSPAGPPTGCDSCGGEHFVLWRPGAGRDGIDLGPGDHAAAIVNDDRRKSELIRSYLLNARPGERVIAPLGLPRDDLLRAELLAAGVTVESWSGPDDESFDPESAIHDLEQAASDGAILRLAGLLDRTTLPKLEHGVWSRFEQGAGKYDQQVIALCLYDARDCDQSLLDVARGHRLVCGRSRLHVNVVG